MEEKQDYFKVGSREQPVISNSSLSYISPEQGGSPQAFLDFFVEKQEAEKSYYRMGHLIHKWAEDRESFCVSEVEKPSDKLGDVADCALNLVKSEMESWELDKIENIRDPSIPYVADYDEIVLEACKLQRWNPKWGDEALIKNAVPAIKPYLEDIVKAENSHKIYITKKEAETIECCVKAVEKHPVAKELLFMQDTDFSNKKVYKELEIYWSKDFTYTFSPSLEHPDGNPAIIKLHFKAKLDSLVIDFDKKKITYTDPKTTSGGAYNFSKSFETYRYYRQQAFYNWSIKEWCKQNNIDLTGFSFTNYNIAIDTNGLYQVVVYPISFKWMLKGTKEYQSLVKRILEHTATNQWNYSLEEFSNGLVLDIPYKEDI